MELGVDDSHPGTDERTWLGSRQLAGLLQEAQVAHQRQGCGAARIQRPGLRWFWRPFEVFTEAAS
jgi:hypothetical protein